MASGCEIPNTATKPTISGLWQLLKESYLGVLQLSGIQHTFKKLPV